MNDIPSQSDGEKALDTTPEAEATTRRGLLGMALAGAAGIAAAAPTGALAQSSAAPPIRSAKPSAGRRFAGKAVLITGGTSGIGEATARAFAREGGRVFFNGRRQTLGRRVQAEIRAAGGDATYHRSDVRIEAQVRAFVAACVAAYGRVDIAFNNAGIMVAERARLNGTSEATYRDVMDTNVGGVFFGMKHEIAQMLTQGGGTIVNTCSMGGFKAAGPQIGPYIASKHAVLGLTRVGAVEYAKDNIRITSVAPGIVDTPMLRRPGAEGDAAFEALAASTPMGRAETPEEIAQLVMFLSSDDAGALHGSNVDASAGFLD